MQHNATYHEIENLRRFVLHRGRQESSGLMLRYVTRSHGGGIYPARPIVPYVYLFAKWEVFM